ncbi:RNA polymerase-associated protein [Fusarium oxysporum f. sp. conglutinans race 2 54008]|uniref:RNA polymerase-associated protein n=1 Tax=Fusarium oxysporum f. sp. conglutinans race 2 54008 TaxID=1089457 RepID=X0H302_FUSOX|nr:RNA polymerase-associated protein [Fusarium oxysporum f. sp. conglutinans race 2 54008]
MSPDPRKPHLYEHPVSSYAQKVKIALREKNIEFTSEVPEDMASSTWGPLHNSNPRVEVPVLLHNDNTIFDSPIILEYIEEVWPGPQLLPKDPGARAKARMIQQICDTHYEALNWCMSEIRVFGRATGDLQYRLEEKAKQQTATLQAWLEQRLSGPWFNGDAFGWADVCAIPMVNRSVFYDFGPAEGSKLKAWHQRVIERESVKVTLEEYHKGAEAMRAPWVKEVILSGQRKREYRDHRLEWMVKNGGFEVIEKGIKKDNIRFNWP